MPQGLEITNSLIAIYEGKDDDRLEVLKQYRNDTEDVLSNTAREETPITDDFTISRLRSMVLQDVATIHDQRFVELLDEDQRPDHFMPFIYTSLPSSRHIRLLQLEGEFEKFRECKILAGKLIVVPLDEAPKYEALSYTWGTRDKTVPVLLGDRRILVTPNLAVALQYLRYRREDVPKCWLWVDQICINQDDLNERSQQVRIMREIYQKSAQTTIWLGLNHQSVQRLNDRLFSKIWPYIKDDPINSLQPDLDFATRQRPKDIPDHKDEIWTELVELVRRPWFRRIWVVQEARASASKSIVTVQVGKRSISWNYLALVMTWLIQKGFSSIHKDLRILLFVAKIFNFGSMRLPLLHQLQETRQFRATDARDKIFALTGIVDEGQDESKLPECLQPDYTKSIQEVYQAVTIYLIKQSMDLQVLSYVQHITPDVAEDADLPEVKVPSDAMQSWVARWESEHANGSPIIDAPFFNASAGKVLDIKILKKQHALKIKGVLFDRVTYVSKICQNSTWILDEEIIATKNPVFEAWQQIQHRLDEPPSVTLKALMMALLCGKLATNKRATSDTQLFLSFCAYMHYLFIMRVCNSTFKELGLINADVSILERVEKTANPISQAKPDSIVYRIHETLGYLGNGQNPDIFIRKIACARQRKVFTTSTGYVGMGPAAIQDGDTIVILYGGRVPYILRAQGEHFRFVGESYVHGMMDGEGIKSASEKGVTPQYFELR